MIKKNLREEIIPRKIYYDLKKFSTGHFSGAGGKAFIAYQL